MKFTRVRPVKTPCYGTPGSAGIDFFVPEDQGPFIVTPNTDILIPSGVIMDIPEGYMLMGADKSGVVMSDIARVRAGFPPGRWPDRSPGAVLITGAKIVDEDYEGEIHIHLINVGLGPVTIRPGMKAAQFILVPVVYAALTEAPRDELFPDRPAGGRGTGMAGSTGIY